jgi:hypothetical protein
VITFVHGWKNNANNDPRDKNGNVLGFEGVLEYLAKDVHPGTPVVGIYIGWRGDLVSKYWPIRRQFSYFNREQTAIRIPGTSMTSALTRTMVETRAQRRDARMVMVGHSFGALVLERALSQTMGAYVLEAATSPSPQTTSDVPHADLIVFVNSAAAATEGKQMIELLRRARRGRTAAAGGEPPLFLSISSLGDAATRFAMPMGHGPSFLGFGHTGSWRTYADPDPPSVQKQKDYYLSTTAHMQALQSHLVVETKDAAECGSAKMIIPPFSLRNGITYQVCEKPDRWNDTRYWAMQMPASIVRDHSGIFNLNFFDLLELLMTRKNPSGEPSRAL